MTDLAEQPGLFDVGDLRPPLPPLVYPHNLLPEQDAAPNIHTLLDLYDGWSGEREGRPWEDRWAAPEHAWRPCITGPSYELGVERCTPVIVTTDLRCHPHSDHGRDCHCVGDLLYRHGCASCGHMDPARASENEAAEDAMDHAWTGWRELPLAPGWSYNGPAAGKAKAADAWLASLVDAGYDADWITGGGPHLTARSHLGRRHVPGRSPWGGYDMAVVQPEEVATR